MITAIVSQLSRPSVVIEVDANSLTLDAVQSRLATVTGIPVDEQRLTTVGGLPCSTLDGMLRSPCNSSNRANHVVYLSLSMCMQGGKGGFGSELRKMGARLAARKATNFDSCRDLNGRRLKTTKRAKTLVDYMEGEEERQQQKKEKIKRKIAKYSKEPAPKKHRFDDTAYFDTNERIQEDVRLAVQQAIQQEEEEEDITSTTTANHGCDNDEDTAVTASSSPSASSSTSSGTSNGNKTATTTSAFAMWDADLGDLGSSSGTDDERDDEDDDASLSSNRGTSSKATTAITTTTATTTTTTNDPPSNNEEIQASTLPASKENTKTTPRTPRKRTMAARGKAV